MSTNDAGKEQSTRLEGKMVSREAKRLPIVNREQPKILQHKENKQRSSTQTQHRTDWRNKPIEIKAQLSCNNTSSDTMKNLPAGSSTGR
ncbi:hypothetical protein KI387_015882, partial [Taxus chinensis]